MGHVLRTLVSAVGSALSCGRDVGDLKASRHLDFPDGLRGPVRGDAREAVAHADVKMLSPPGFQTFFPLRN